jgi:hypothetical protein
MWSPTRPTAAWVKRKYDRPEERDTSIRVRTERLEEVLSGTPKVDFIKIDVEGAEYLVLEGARNLVLRHKPVIVFEHGKGASDCYGVTPAALHDLLCREYALRISLLADYLRGRPALDKSAFHDQFELGLNYYFIAHP